MEKGFYTALGTPVDDSGRFCSRSMIRQLEQQLAAGASGLLVMGSMGNEAYLRSSEYPKVAACCAAVVKGAVPLLVGVTDVSIGRVLDRIDALKDIPAIDGFVSTVPYYSTVRQEEILAFYQSIAERSARPLYLYDLAVVTKTAIAPDTVRMLWNNTNIKGIKSGNLVTQRILMHAEDRPEDFDQMFSNLDEFDIAYKCGIDKNLDGMFACTPATARRMYRALDAGDYQTAALCLDGIIRLRDLFASTPCLMMAFSHAMNLLGCTGCFGVDYQMDIPDSDKERITQAMKDLGEI